jgi:hypothetical protein
MKLVMYNVQPVINLPTIPPKHRFFITKISPLLLYKEKIVFCKSFETHKYAVFEEFRVLHVQADGGPKYCYYWNPKR